MTAGQQYGRVTIYTPEGKQIVKIHRLRAEIALGKPLPPTAIVHHVDDSTNEDAPLVICQDIAYHKLLHLRAKIVAAGGNPNTDKVCSACKLPKLLMAFGVDRTGPLGRQGTCKSCQSARQRRYYAADPQKYRDKTRSWRAAHC